jgi:hypothetical protein
MQHNPGPDYIPVGCIPTLGSLQMAAETMGRAVRCMPMAAATEKDLLKQMSGQAVPSKAS